MDETDETAGVTERLVAPVDTRQGGFRLALVFAVLLHAAFLVQIGRAVPRSIGDPSGQTDAISVEIVSAADLDSRETVALPPPGVAAPPPAPSPVEAAPRPQEPPPPDAAEAPKPAEPAPEAAQSPAPPPDPKQADQKQPEPKEAEQKAEKKAEELPNFETALADLANEPMPSDKPSEAPEEKSETPPEKAEAAKPAEPQKKAEAAPKPAEPAKKEAKKTPPKKQAALDMPPSPDAASAPPGRSAAATRPPGITRSGENDEFGRAVIRALRSTMPPPRGVLGSVVVRLILTANGDLAEVQVLQPSGRRGLDESVVFATKQTYFPLPPYKATLADRTFTIRYVYR